jgi:hypothetical protein
MSRAHAPWSGLAGLSLLLVLTLPLQACRGPAHRGMPEEPDAATSDAGSDDAGPGDAGISPLSLTASPNPNSVLSGIARVQWTMPLTSIRVRVSSGASTQWTPAHAVAGESGSLVIPLLPLQAQTTYTAVAVGTDSTGGTISSDVSSFKTGPLPSLVPLFDVADGGTPSPGNTLISVLAAGGLVTTDYLTVTDSTGAPVWYYAADSRLAGDFQQQPDGTFTMAVLDSSEALAGLDDSLVIYRQVDVLGARLALWAAQDVPDASPPVSVVGTDGHDLRIQPNGDALLFGFVSQTMDMTAWGGVADAQVVANVLERITPTGFVTFSWNAFSYLDVANIDPASGSVTGPNVDFTHGNSIDVMADGNYLLGMRNLSQLLKIDSSTGAVLWKLGGKDGQFAFLNDPLGGFSCQHGGRELPNGDIILFDDGNGHSPPRSRAVEYQLDTTAMTATLVWSAEDNPPLFSYILGYAQRLPNSNTLISYGTALHIQEVDPAGNILWDLSDPTSDLGFYRAYRLDSLSPLVLTSE